MVLAAEVPLAVLAAPAEDLAAPVDLVAMAVVPEDSSAVPDVVPDVAAGSVAVRWGAAQ